MARAADRNLGEIIVVIDQCGQRIPRVDFPQRQTAGAAGDREAFSIRGEIQPDDASGFSGQLN